MHRSIVRAITDEVHCRLARLTLEREDSGTTYSRKIRITNTKTGAFVEPDDGFGLSSPTTGGTDVRIGAFNTSPDPGSITVEFDNVVVRRW